MDLRPDVYDHLTVASFFRAWTAWPEEGVVKTHRAIGEQIGLTHGHVGLFMRGERPLPRDKEWARLVALVQLDEEEQTYLLALDELRSAPASMRTAALHKVQSLRARHAARQLTDERLSYFDHWYLPAIRELQTVPGAPQDAEALSLALHPPVSVEQVHEAIVTLEALDLGAGRLTTGDDLYERRVTAFQRQILGLAADSLLELPASERESQSFTAAVSDRCLEELRRELRDAVGRWMAICEHDQDPKDRVVQIGLYAFPVAMWGDDRD